MDGYVIHIYRVLQALLIIYFIALTLVFSFIQHSTV